MEKAKPPNKYCVIAQRSGRHSYTVHLQGTGPRTGCKLHRTVVQSDALLLFIDDFVILLHPSTACSFGQDSKKAKKETLEKSKVTKIEIK